MVLVVMTFIGGNGNNHGNNIGGPVVSSSINDDN